MSYSTEPILANNNTAFHTDSVGDTKFKDSKTKDVAVSRALAAKRFPSRRTVTIVNTQKVSEGIFLLDFEDSYIASCAKPGQFINLYSHNPLFLLPRPFGIARICGNVVTVIYAVIGQGTLEFSKLRALDSIDVLGPLGRGFDINESTQYVLVGGGLGIPPLIYAAQYISAMHDKQTQTTVPNKRPIAFLGYRDSMYADSLIAPYVESVQSISGSSGTVLDILNEFTLDSQDAQHDTVILTCGPEAMMRAVNHWALEHNISCQMSLEERMGCGYGTCVACAVDTREGRVKVCTEGPVFNSSQLDWN